MVEISSVPAASPDQERATLAVTGCIRADSVIQAALASVLRSHGISPAGFNMLMILDGEGGPLCPHELSERRLVTRGTVTGVLDSLEHAGLVERRPHPVDRRSLLIELTDEGQALLARVVPDVRRAEGELLGDLSATERDVLVALLARIAAPTDVPTPEVLT